MAGFADEEEAGECVVVAGMVGTEFIDGLVVGVFAEFAAPEGVVAGLVDDEEASEFAVVKAILGGALEEYRLFALLANSCARPRSTSARSLSLTLLPNPSVRARLPA